MPDQMLSASLQLAWECNAERCTLAKSAEIRLIQTVLEGMDKAAASSCSISALGTTALR